MLPETSVSEIGRSRSGGGRDELPRAWLDRPVLRPPPLLPTRETARTEQVNPAATQPISLRRSPVAHGPPMTKAKRPADGAAATPPNSLWGGRFAGGPVEIMRRINASIDFDKRLYAEDIAGSQAHCAMLVAQNVLSPEDGAAIGAGLSRSGRRSKPAILSSAPSAKTST